MLSDVSPIPLTNSPRQHVALCTKVLDFVADESQAVEDIELDRRSLSQCGSSPGAASNSDQSIILEAQRVLAEQMVSEAETEMKMKRFKVEAARIALLQASHEASCNSSQRSSTRIEIVCQMLLPHQ